MKPSVYQILKAIHNHHRPARTLGGRLKDILGHIQATERRNSAGADQ